MRKLCLGGYGNQIKNWVIFSYDRNPRVQSNSFMNACQLYFEYIVSIISKPKTAFLRINCRSFSTISINMSGISEEDLTNIVDFVYKAAVISTLLNLPFIVKCVWTQLLQLLQILQLFIVYNVSASWNGYIAYL